MDVLHCDSLDSAAAHRLIEDICDHYSVSEHALVMLDRQPDDVGLIRSLSCSVQTIKEHLALLGFSPVIPLITSVSELLNLLRDGGMPYTPLISDLVLLILDRVRVMVDRFRDQGFVEYDQQQVAELSRHIENITCGTTTSQEQSIAAAIQWLDPTVVVDVDLGADGGHAAQDEFLSELGLAGDRDLEFFRELMAPVERRSRHWHGRSDRILKMALILNRLGGSPVNDKQLAVAVYVHDFGMAFIPLELLHKNTTLSNSDIQLLRSHVQSSVYLLQAMEKWQPAKEIVMQHHEAANGSGYPYGLREKEMCEGAKILAVADTFDALTHQGTYAVHQKRPIIRAVKEINDCAGKQLSPYWVDIFNQAVQPVLLAHRARAC